MRTHPKSILSLPLAVAILGNSAYGQTYAGYVMGYFKESPGGKSNSHALQLAVSSDGQHWLPLNQNQPVLKAQMGTKALRDPFFYRMADGTFTILATDNWNSESIHIWSSPDLRTFANERLVRMNSTGMHAWAPEVFYDAGRKQHAILWSGNTDRNRIYVSYTTDFKTVTPAVVFFDPGFPAIDGHMQLGIDGVNYMYYKSEKDAKLYGTRSTTLEPRSFDNNTYTTGYSPTFTYSHTEAPILVRSLDQKTWWLWGDSYIPDNAAFYAWKTSSLAGNTWVAADRRDYTAPPNSKHATILPITQTEMSNLIAKWGRPEFEVIKSYRLANSFVRHANNTGKVSNYPFDPVEDMQWKIVPGLADPTGISIQATNVTNAYLRQANDIVGLATNDNSTAFKSAATFYKDPGFARSSWASLRSHARPDRYLRKSNDSTLRLDPITASSTATDKEDATFQFVYSSMTFPATSLAPDPRIGSHSAAIRVWVDSRGEGRKLLHVSLSGSEADMLLDIDLFGLDGRRVAHLFTGRTGGDVLQLALPDPSGQGGARIVRISSGAALLDARAVMLD